MNRRTDPVRLPSAPLVSGATWFHPPRPSGQRSLLPELAGGDDPPTAHPPADAPVTIVEFFDPPARPVAPFIPS